MIKVDLENMGTINKNKINITTDKTDTTLYFSYSTIVGFNQYYEGKQYEAICQNEWSNTTGKLLNELEPDKSKRVKRDDFNMLLNDCLIRIS